MLARIRKRLSYTNVALTLALVFAMTGGAYAAGRYVITSTKQIKPSVLKQLKGQAGAPGAQGPAGQNGAAGAKGDTGAEGKQGPEGKEGAEGKQGKEGKEGPEGPEGPEGSPWTASGTLPSGKTETGTWTLSSTSSGVARIAISFPIPLKAKANPVNEPALEESQVHFVKEGTPASASCGANESSGHGAPVPTAAPGNLCIYETILLGAPAELSELHVADPGSNLPGAGVAGAMFWFSVAAGEAQGWGTWAVTAP
jgi:hypothetical protein